MISHNKTQLQLTRTEEGGIVCVPNGIHNCSSKMVAHVLIKIAEKESETISLEHFFLYLHMCVCMLTLLLYMHFSSHLTI